MKKRYVCIDLEMTEFTASQRTCVPGANGEVIQFGAVMLDEDYNLLSEFSSYVKPVFSSVTAVINQLTGISNKSLEKADDFITVFDKFAYWRGEGDITTFCWSKSDFNQHWASAAMKLLQMDYKGQVHSALSDSYNTARILHKLFCTESLNLDFEYMNPTKETSAEKQRDQAEYNCSFASFLSPELLSQFGYRADAEEEPAASTYEETKEDFQLIKDSPLAGLINNEEIAGLCSKYNIEVHSWLKLATQVMATQEMQVA